MLMALYCALWLIQYLPAHTINAQSKVCIANLVALEIINAAKYLCAGLVCGPLVADLFQLRDRSEVRRVIEGHT